MLSGDVSALEIASCAVTLVRLIRLLAHSLWHSLKNGVNVLDEISQPYTKFCLLMHVTSNCREVVFDVAFRKYLRYWTNASDVALAFNANAMTAVGCACVVVVI